jgi:hypothetical protein
VEQKIKQALGEQLFSILFLQVKLEEAQKELAEAEKRRTVSDAANTENTG